MSPRKLVRDSVGFAAAQYVVRLLLMLRGVIAARMLGPGAYGAWNGLLLVLEYGMFAPLGSQQGLDQAVPPRIVEGDRERLLRIKRAGLFNVAISSALFVAGTLIYFSRSEGALRSFWGLGGILGVLACVVLTHFGMYYLSLQRSHGNIGSVSVWYAIQGGIGTVLGLSLIPWLGAWGLLWGWLASTAIALLYTRLTSPPTFPAIPRPSRDSLLLIRVGFPMFLYLGAGLVMRSIDRLMVLRFLGAEALGYYSLGYMGLMLLLYLPDSVTYVLYPHFQRTYRTAGNRAEAIRGGALRALRVLTVTVAGLGGLLFLGAREGVMMLLPSFLPGATVVRVLCFGAASLAITGFSSILLMTLGRHSQLIVASLIATAVGLGLDFFALQAGYGITGVAWAMFLTYAFHAVIMLWLVLGGLEVPGGRRLVEMWRGFAPVAASLVLAAVIDAFLPGRVAPNLALRLGRLVLAAALFMAAYAALVRPLVSGLGLRQILIELRLPFSGIGRRPPDLTP